VDNSAVTISEMRALWLSARMSEIKNIRQTWMALNTFKCNYLTPVQSKGLRGPLTRCETWQKRIQSE